MIVEPAPAKINLALHVRHRRPDGYHELETLFAFARHGDVVRVQEADQDAFSVAGPFAPALGNGGASTGNLVVRARDAFREVIGCPPVALALDKTLPVASGIGGGSADAAATLRALARLTGMVQPDLQLDAIARNLGADVPACLTGTTSLGTGRGDELVPVDGLAGTPLLLVNPGVGVSTAAVFAGWNGVDLGPIEEGDLLSRARAGRNDLEAPARLIAPVIGAVLALLSDARGALLARMSGSGATCFALFATEPDRDRAADAASVRGWWTLGTEVK